MQKSHRTRIIVALGTAQTLAFGTTFYLPAILAEPMARDIGVPTSWAFGAFSLALLISAFLGPLFGARIDRFGGRNILSSSSLVFAAGLGILGLSDSMAVMCLAWLVIGIGMSMGLYESAFATLVGLFGSTARGPITGITLIAGFASTICWPISAGIEAEYGWRIVCFFWAGTHIVLGLPLNRLLIPAGNMLSDPARVETATPPARLSRRDYVSLPMILLAFVFAASWFTATAMAAHLPRLLQISGMDASSAILAASLVGPAQVAGRVLEFGLLRHWHPMISARLATLMHPVGAALLMVLGGPAGMIFTGLHGTGNGILTIAKGTLPLAVFGPNGYGARQGFLVAPSRFAQAAAPFLFGMLIDATGTQALWLTILLGGLAGLTLWFVRPSVKG